MRVTITIEDEKQPGVTVERSDAEHPLTISEPLPAELQPVDAGGPPGWLLEELQGGAAAEGEARSAAGPTDAGPAPAPTENGLVPVQSYPPSGR
jgi:hypothetical protein